MTTAFDSQSDIIDSRQIIERIAELREDDQTETETERWLNNAELETLERLAEDASDYSEDWEYGATLIRESYFEDYAREQAVALGAISGEEQWPANYIDWERAARELAVDYTLVKFEDTYYYVR